MSAPPKKPLDDLATECLRVIDANGCGEIAAAAVLVVYEDGRVGAFHAVKAGRATTLIGLHTLAAHSLTARLDGGAMPEAGNRKGAIVDRSDNVVRVSFGAAGAEPCSCEAPRCVKGRTGRATCQSCGAVVSVPSSAVPITRDDAARLVRPEHERDALTAIGSYDGTWHATPTHVYCAYHEHLARFPIDVRRIVDGEARAPSNVATGCTCPGVADSDGLVCREGDALFRCSSCGGVYGARAEGTEDRP